MTRKVKIKMSQTKMLSRVNHKVSLIKLFQSKKKSKSLLLKRWTVLKLEVIY